MGDMEHTMSANPEAIYTRISRSSLGDILHRSAMRWPEKAAIIDGEQELSYAELDRRANAFAHYMLAQNLPRGARVAMSCAIPLKDALGAASSHPRP